MLIGLAFKGALPAAQFTQVITCPSQFVALATRTAVDGPEDLDNVITIQEGLTITPLSQFLNTPAPAPAPEITFPPYTPELNGTPKLLEYLGLFLQWHTTPLFEMALLKRLARLNVGSNLEFNLDEFPSDVQDAIKEGVAAAHGQIEDRGNKLGSTINGWEYTPPMGNYGEDYLFRSAVAWKFKLRRIQVFYLYQYLQGFRGY